MAKILLRLLGLLAPPLGSGDAGACLCLRLAGRGHPQAPGPAFGIDHGVLANDQNALVVACGLIVALYAVRGVFAYCQAYMSEYLSQTRGL